MIEVFINHTTLPDGSEIYSVEMVLDSNLDSRGYASTVQFHCVDFDHAVRLESVISECVEVNQN